MRQLKESLKEISVWIFRLRVLSYWAHVEGEEIYIAALKDRDPYEYVDTPTCGEWGTTVAEALAHAERRKKRYIKKLVKLGAPYSAYTTQNQSLAA